MMRSYYYKTLQAGLPLAKAPRGLRTARNRGT